MSKKTKQHNIFTKTNPWIANMLFQLQLQQPYQPPEVFQPFMLFHRQTWDEMKLPRWDVG